MKQLTYDQSCIRNYRLPVMWRDCPFNPDRWFPDADPDPFLDIFCNFVPRCAGCLQNSTCGRWILKRCNMMVCRIDLGYLEGSDNNCVHQHLPTKLVEKRLEKGQICLHSARNTVRAESRYGNVCNTTVRSIHTTKKD